ncbi:MAG TPA: RNA polymerase sigma factor [Solirubrobacterales bacterium]|nr:RNA polymerase sigma factor [Solirubrobacterales bacterium]
MEESIPLPKRGGVSPLRQSEARLARRAAKGDQAAFAEIFERHAQELYRYCRAILGNPDDAQDALQNTMDRVLRALPGEGRTIHLRPWLFRVARNESISLIRNRADTVELTEASVPAVPAADIHAEHREAVRTLVSDLASLPEAQRSALVLHELSGLSHDEISQALQRSPRASRQAVYEARLALQELREGRSMDCDEIRAAISDGDGRVVRGRRIRSHLRDCERCSDFARAIDHRRTQLSMLAPPLPAAAATGLIASVLGGGSAAGGLAGAGAASGVVTGSVAIKSAGIVAASLAIGVGGASIAGVDVPLVGKSGQNGQAEEHLQEGTTPAQGPEDSAPIGTDDANDRDRGERSQSGSNAQEGDKKAKANGHGPKSDEKKRKSDPPAHSNAGGNPDGADSGPPDHSNAGGSSGGTTGPPPQSNAGGNSSGGTTTGPPAHSNEGGNSASTTTGPPENSNAGGNSDKEK